MKDEKTHKSNNILNGVTLGNKLQELTIEECEDYLKKQDYKSLAILGNPKEFYKTFLVLDDEKAELLLLSLSKISLEKFGICEKIRDIFDDFQLHSGVDNKYFIQLLRMIFHCNHEEIETILKELEKSLHQRYANDLYKTEEAKTLFIKEIKLIQSLDDYAKNHETSDKKTNESFKSFLGKSIMTLFKITEKDKVMNKENSLDLEKEISIKLKELKQVAKNTLRDPNLGHKILADILQIITGAFIVMMPVRILTGKSPLFSTANTGRQEKIEEMANSILRGNTTLSINS